MPLNKNKQSGFTLIELLIVISLLGMLSGIVFGFFSMNLRTYHSGVTSQEVQSEMRNATNFMVDELRGAYDVKIPEEHEGRRIEYTLTNYKDDDDNDNIWRSIEKPPSENIIIFSENVLTTNTRVIGKYVDSLEFSRSSTSNNILITLKGDNQLSSGNNNADLTMQTSVSPRNLK